MEIMSSELVQNVVNGLPLTPMASMDHFSLVKINVGGRLFMTHWNTLKRLPGTTLSEIAQLKQRHPNYCSQEGWFFFDRNPDAFSSILEYYRTDEFHLSESVCGLAITRELDYWGLNEAEIEPCCWGNYAKFQSHKETLHDLEAAFEDDDPTLDLDSPESRALVGWKRTQRKGWMHLEYPSKSRIAKVIMVVSMVMVLLSMVTTVLESHYVFRVVKLFNGTTIAAPEPTISYNCSNPLNNGTKYVPCPTDPHPVILRLDEVCLGYFLLEIIVRAIFAPDKCKFIKAPFTIIDIICIIPQLISLIIQNGNLNADATGDTSYQRATYSRASGFLNAIVALRTIRILRVFKLMKYYSAFKILAYTIKVSLKELVLLIAFFASGVILFACVIHYAEEETFHSIPIGLWWAVVTMTTVGYGDYAPKRAWGFVIGSLCGLCGVLVIAFTVPIVVNNFTMYYTHAKTRRKLPRDSVRDSRKKKLLQKTSTISTLCSTNEIVDSQNVLKQPPVIPIPLFKSPSLKSNRNNNLTIPVNNNIRTVSEESGETITNQSNGARSVSPTSATIISEPPESK